MYFNFCRYVSASIIFAFWFRKGYNVQHASMRSVENQRTCLDKDEKVGAFLIDLSKGVDCIRHDLLIAMLHAYGFSCDALLLVYSSHAIQNQRVKINMTYTRLFFQTSETLKVRLEDYVRFWVILSISFARFSYITPVT